MVGGLLDRGVEIEFVGRAGARELAQPPQRDLDVADAELDIAVEILELALVPHLHGAVVAVLLLPDAHAFRDCSRGRRTARCRRCRSTCCRPGGGPSVPRAACRSVSMSLSQPIASICFFSSSVRYFSASFFSHSAGISALLHGVEQALQPLEHGAEHAVELVEVALVLHQGGARQIVEILDRLLGEVGVERLHQRQIFAQGHRDLRVAQAM